MTLSSGRHILLPLACGTVLLFASTACSDLEPVGAGTADAAEIEGSAESSPSLSGAGASSTVTAGQLVFDLPEGWAEVTPDSAMRLAQLSFPGSGGDGRLAVFHFGVDGGGGVDANLTRWLGQLAEPSEPTRESFQTENYQVTWVDAAGKLKKSGIGSFPTEDMPGYRLYGAVIEGTGGPWYLRAVGPDATMREARESFLALLESARPL